MYKLVNMVLTLAYQVSSSGTLNKFYCLRLFVVVYKLVNVVLTLGWYCVYTSVPSLIVRNTNKAKL